MNIPRRKKSFGQHFLKDKGVLFKMANAILAESCEWIVEIGPGRGALTRVIIDAGYKEERLILIEADRELIPFLEKEFPQAILIQGDASKIFFDDLIKTYIKDTSWMVAGNLPYNVSNPILMNILRSKQSPKSVIAMVQKEVAQRIFAKPGEMSVLSVAAQLYAKGKILFHVPPGAFSPPPKVDSSIFRLVPEDKRIDEEAIITLVKTAFSSKRKQLHKNLANAGIAESALIKKILEEMHQNPLSRAQDLSIEDWIQIYSRIF